MAGACHYGFFAVCFQLDDRDLGAYINAVDRHVWVFGYLRRPFVDLDYDHYCFFVTVRIGYGYDVAIFDGFAHALFDMFIAAPPLEAGGSA